jgi:hypothetical protein
VLSDGWQEAVADRVTEYAQNTWERLSRPGRKRNCAALARMAREILNAKEQIHDLAGQLSGEAASLFGIEGAPRAFAEELVANIPIAAMDAKMVAAVRGIQITGILLCMMDNRDLATCQCFIDLALTESKEQVKRILVAGMYNWTGLARFAAAR